MTTKKTLFWISFIPLMIINSVMSALSEAVVYAYVEIDTFSEWWECYCFDHVYKKETNK